MTRHIRKMPELSVIIPTRNRAGLVRALIQSLLSQDESPVPWEIVVVNNGSSDNTEQAVREFGLDSIIAVRHVFEESPGLHRARHRGLREARGKFVAYLDDDMLVSKRWVCGVLPLLEKRADAVVGRIFPKWEAEPPEWLCGLIDGGTFAYLGLLDLGDKEKPVPGGHIFGGNCFIEKDIVLELGGFHPDGMPSELLRFRGDGETGLMEAFSARGLSGLYSPTAAVYHIISPQRMTEDYLCKRAYAEGVSRSFALVRKNGGLLSDSEVLIQDGRKRAGEVEQVLDQNMRLSFWDGFSFHQQELKKDPELLHYVLKETFL